jgi:hypothetical protein
MLRRSEMFAVSFIKVVMLRAAVTNEMSANFYQPIRLNIVE